MIIRHTLFNTLTALFIIFSFKLALAAIPPTLNYQGHLTDSSGVPIDGPVNMVFAIYDIDTGGTALWSDTRSVTIDQGVFSVELGSTPNPFPPGLFENPLWMGLSVGTDAEMIPRRPISSTAFSFKAGDANTLDGVSASTLDQSAHVIDTANPHSVTPGQIGAADAAILSAHTGNTSNPHSVSAAQTGAVSGTDFTTHTSNSAAHHSRYSNSEAVTAMGLQHDSNSLNHSKYTDTNTVTAMLANDGPGSTLDSDKVDGLEASELIDAAQDEVRTPISSLPFTINTPGSYYLTGNLDGSSGGIDITVDGVMLDFMGFTIDGRGTVNDYGIFFDGRSNVIIKNGTISNFGLAGIYQGVSTVHYATMIDMRALGNGTLGASGFHSGINILSRNSHVERCTAGNNGGHGIYVYTSSKLINNIAFNNQSGYGIGTDSGSVLSGNTVYNNTVTYGLLAGTGSTVTGNTVYANTATYAIYAGGGSSLIGNTAYNNTGTYGIYAGSGTSLIANTSRSNSNWGIYGVGSNLIKDNVIYLNNYTATANQGGLRIGNDSRVIGNMLDSNAVNNIYVASSDNTIENNLVTDSSGGNGINFALTGNFWANNRASGNIANFLNTAGQTDGGGNFSF